MIISKGKNVPIKLNQCPPGLPKILELVITAAIPANGPDVLCDDDVGGICWRFDLNLALMS
ncbi:MAG TPA: hypothetical protein VK667_07670, partial [Ktedonobacteraceae bacterium]|nr:hypothetical protein [Ktedonobacteraceae bacterium]